MATREQIETIELRAFNDCAREMARDGVGLTFKQADDLGGQALDWLSKRLGLRVTETDCGVTAKPHAGHAS